MRGVPLAVMLCAFGALSACAGNDAAASMRLPDWNGPAIVCSHRLDGAMSVEMTVPTGGHQLALAHVARQGRTASVRLDYAPPIGDVVPQVITTLRIEIAAEQLGDATAVLVELGAPGDGAAKLAVATARPQR